MNSGDISGGKFSRTIPSGHGLVVFDGECVLCNFFIEAIYKYDKSKKLYFTTLPSENPDLRSIIPFSDKSYANSVTLYYGGNIYTESKAIMEIASLLGGWWKILLAGYVLPAFFRNMIYRIIARNRYKWFGKRTHCFVPPEEDLYRFIP